MVKPFALELQPFTEEILLYERVVRECVGMATMQKILGRYHHLPEWSAGDKLTNFLAATSHTLQKMYRLLKDISYKLALSLIEDDDG